LTTSDRRSEIQEYIDKVKNESDIDRAAKTEKTGAFTGSFATNPVNQEKIPVWIADYVLMA